VNQLKEIWEKGDLMLRAEIKVRTHQILKPEGEACDQCHTKNNNLLDISALGASEEQKHSYQKNTIVDFFKHYNMNDKNPEQDKAISDKKNISDTQSPGIEQQESIQRIRITELLN